MAVQETMFGENSEKLNKPEVREKIIKKYVDVVIKEISKLKKRVSLSLGIYPGEIFSAQLLNCFEKYSVEFPEKKF